MSVDIKFDEMIEKIFHNFNKVTPMLISLLATTIFLLFAPKEVLVKIGIGSMHENVKLIIGIVFLILSFLLITLFINFIIKYFKKFYFNKVTVKKLRNKFIKLDDSLKSLLIDLLNEEELSKEYNSAAGNIMYLTDNKFIYRSSLVLTQGYNGLYATFVPHPWLIDLYNNEPELFSISKKHKK